MSNKCSNFKKVTVFLKTEITFLNKTKLFHFKRLKTINTGQRSKLFLWGNFETSQFPMSMWRSNELQVILYKHYIAGFKLYLISENWYFIRVFPSNTNLTFIQKKLVFFQIDFIFQSLVGNICFRANEIIKYLFKYLSNLTCIYNSYNYFCCHESSRYWVYLLICFQKHLCYQKLKLF